MLKTLIGNREYRLAFWIALGIMVLASLPYIFGYAIAPPGYRFIGFTYNVDDACVYMSWMRQAADGHFFLRNLFTTEPQHGHGFNLLFLAMGWFGRITHMPLVGVFHFFRVIFGMMLLLSAYALSGIWLKDRRAQRLCLLVVGLSSGIGWMLPPKVGVMLSTDTWQPETITFLSAYLSPLYTFPTLLVLWTVYCLHRLDESRDWKYAVRAGLLLLVLANVHTYDLITVALVWMLYAAIALAGRRSRPALGGLIAAGIALPLAAYQVYFYYTETIFRTRAAVPTIAPPLVWYMTGYGLLLPLAIMGVWRALKERKNVTLLICWALVGFIAIYLPVSFQRRLIMGTHIPLSILTTIGLFSLVKGRLPILRSAAITIVVLVMMISNLDFLVGDMNSVMQNESQTIAHVPFISRDESAVFDFLRTHLGANDVILAPPGTAGLIPGYAGRTVYAGHWGETVDYKWKLLALVRFYLPDGPDSYRREFLKDAGINYVVGYHNIGGVKTDVYDFREKPVPYLRTVFDRPEISVYEVLRDRL